MAKRTRKQKAPRRRTPRPAPSRVEAVEREGWTTWPGALGLGAVSFVLVQIGLVPAVLLAVIAGSISSGTDMTITDEPGRAVRMAYVAGAVAFLVPPAVAVWSARRAKPTTTLSALVASVAIAVWGLAKLGVL